MATLDDIVAASEILEEKSETLMGGSSSELDESCVRTFDKVGDGLVVDLCFQEEDKQVVENLKGISNSDKTVSIVGSLDYSVEMEGSDDKQLNGSGRDDVDVDLNGHVEGKRIDVTLEGLNHGFRVGDFVWGKIRSHPWWPGQVYDPKDASEFAVKYFQEGYLLVAFYGDGSCSWCLPSQLIPFVENFEEMSKKSSSRSFLYAIEMALDAISRLMEVEMTCKCISKEIKVGVTRPVVANVGVKTRILVPDVSSHRLCLPKYEPGELLSKVRHFAEAVSSGNVFELAILTSFLSAFCHYNGGYPLCRYHEPYHIEGLEDKNISEEKFSNGNCHPMEDNILGGPHSDDKIYHRRKQKSVAELMERDTEIVPISQKRARVDNGNKLEKSISSLKQTKIGDEVNEGASVSTYSTGKSDRKKKVVVLVLPKILSGDIFSAETVSARGVSHASKGALSGIQNIIDASATKLISGEVSCESECVTTPRDRKKSKYLSPPFTNPLQRTGKSRSKMELEIDSIEVDRINAVGEQLTKAAEHPFASSRTTHSVVDEMSEEKLPNDQPERHHAAVSTAVSINQNDVIAFSASYVNAPVNEVVSEIRIAAVNPLCSSSPRACDMISDFVSIFRSSTFVHGSNFKMYRKYNTSKQGKPTTFHHRNLDNDLTQKKVKSSALKPCKAVIPQIEGKFDTSKFKKAEESPIIEPMAGDVNENGAAELILTFTPEIPLPSKEAIVEYFSKFGILNDAKTNVMTDSHTVQIVYATDFDAKAASQSSFNQRSFGFESITYRFQQSSAHSRTNGSRARGSSYPKEAPPCVSYSVDDLMSEVGVIKQKFEKMSAIVEKYHTRLSPEDRSSLKDVMKTLMESAETASEKVRTVAEKTKS